MKRIVIIFSLLLTMGSSHFLQAQSGKITANGITLAYESMGKANRETVLLIAGTGMQLTAWPAELCDELIKRGYRVIRYDNRDVGLSTKLDAAGEPDWPAIVGALMQGKPAPLAYTVDDMANDAAGLLNALGIKKAHIVGVSGGAIIAQTVAAQHPEHTLSLTTMMATTGNPALPPMKPEIQQLILTNPAPPAGDTAAIVTRQVKLMQAFSGPRYPMDEKVIAQYVLSDVRRAYNPAGDARQGAAAMAAGDRRAMLKTIRVPTVVIHGEDDPIVPVAAGKEVAATIPDAALRLIPGMGHQLPIPLIKTIADEIIAVATKAKTVGIK